MEQYTKELGIDTASQPSANCAILFGVGSNGQTKIINTILYEKNGGCSVPNAIGSTIRKSLVAIKHGTKVRRANSRGTIRQVLKEVGIKELEVEKKFDAVTVRKSFTLPKNHQDSVQNRVRCINELCYLIENKLLSPNRE